MRRRRQADDPSFDRVESIVSAVWKDLLMARRGSFTNLLYALARVSATGRAARKGPEALAKRDIRRRVYRAEGKATRRFFRGFGL